MNTIWPTAFERVQFQFSFARAKDIQFDVVAEFDSDMPDFLINFSAARKRLDKEPSIKIF